MHKNFDSIQKAITLGKELKELLELLDQRENEIVDLKSKIYAMDPKAIIDEDLSGSEPQHRKYLNLTTQDISKLGFEAIVKEVEREMITFALQKTKGNQTAAADVLRSTKRVVQYKISSLGIDYKALIDS